MSDSEDKQNQGGPDQAGPSDENDEACLRDMEHVVSCGQHAAGPDGRGRGGSPKPGEAEGINVLVVMMDQLSFRAMGSAGNEHIRTPNLDRLASEGVRFESVVCPAPFCSPSRASMATGLYPHSSGINLNVDMHSKGLQPPLTDQTHRFTEQILHRKGWHTLHRGIWHLGNKADLACYRDLPAGLDHSDEGFDYKPFLDERLPAASVAKGDAEVFERPVYMTRNCRRLHNKYLAWEGRTLQPLSIMGRFAIPPELMRETCLTDQAIQAIERNAGGNWMVTVSWSPPHAYWVAPEPYYSMYDRGQMPLSDDGDKLPEWMRDAVGRRLRDWGGDEVAREYLAIYYALVSMLDAEAGRLLDTIDHLGLADRTLVIFTSDHGDSQGRFGAIGKGIPALCEEIVRVPLLMRLPGKISAGTVIGQQVSLVDIMPTILDYAGADCPAGIHGRSLRPLIEGRRSAGHPFTVCERTATHVEPNLIHRMIRCDEWKYCNYGNGQCQLFDLVNDPWELENLFDDRSKRSTVRHMHGELRKWAERTEDEGTFMAMSADPL